MGIQEKDMAATLRDKERREEWKKRIVEIERRTDIGETQTTIGKHYRCSGETIAYWMKEFGLVGLNKKIYKLTESSEKMDWVNNRLAQKGFSLGDRWRYLTSTEIPNQCPVLGIPIDYSRGGLTYNNDTNASIDRIDSSKGYSIDNIQIMTIRANRVKNNATIEELILIGRWAEKTIRNPLDLPEPVGYKRPRAASGMKGKKHSEETLEKMREANIHRRGMYYERRDLKAYEEIVRGSIV